MLLGTKSGSSKNVMAKIRRISELEEDANRALGIYTYKQYWESFLSSELGELYQALPWSELVAAWGLAEKPLGRKSYFPPAGKIALLLLKHYSGCSDARLISQLNGNLQYQFFCGILINPLAPLKHRQLVSQIRCELSHPLRVESLQKVLADYWKPYMLERENMLIDATCYESEVRYPTDVKLLWESVSWLYPRLKSFHKSLGLRMARTKYNKWSKIYGSYCRQRKPRVKYRRRVKGGLLRLLTKLLGIVGPLEKKYPQVISPREKDRIETIKVVLRQQWAYFYDGIKPKDRIISLAKNYLRPIVRGKETKAVEFGAKVNKIQIDGINFIEHCSFDPFHEGNRLKASVGTGRKLIGKISRVGGDAIYGTNKNRNYCRAQQIFHDFRPKGRKGKWEAHKQILRKAITKERASRLEGSFGNEKNAWYLRRIKAKTASNEILWIFCGIHIANAREIGKRITRAKTEMAA